MADISAFDNFFDKLSPQSGFATKRHKIALKMRKMALKVHKIALKMHKMVLKRHRITGRMALKNI